MRLRSRLRLVQGELGGPPPLRLAFELVALGGGLTLALALAAALPSWRAELGRFQALAAVAFAFHGLALVRLARYRRLPHAGLAVFAIALSARVAVLPVTPSLSDDVYRYVWEGRVVAHGGNPYAHAPNDAALAPLRDAVIHPFVNHPELRAIYPPLALAGFALVSSLSPTVLAMKLWIVLHDLALVAVLAVWCSRRTGSALPALAYAWNPLVVIEFAGNAHNEPTSLLWLVVALWLVEERPVLSALALATAILVKLAPLLALPFLLRRWPWRARLAALLLVVPGLAAYAVMAHGPASGLEAYAATWRNNEFAFDLIARVLRDDRLARIVVAGAVAALVAWMLARGTETLAATRRALRAALLVGPVLHPWYLGWAIAFEPLGRSAPWILLSCTSLLAYGVLAPPREGGAFHLPFAWRLVEYGLPLALAGLLALATGRNRRDVTA